PVFVLAKRHVAPFESAAPQRDSKGFELLRDRRLQKLMIANALWMSIYSLWSNWTTNYLHHTFGLTVQTAAVYAWFPPVASTLGAFAGGWLSRRSIVRGRDNAAARLSAALISAIGCLVTFAVPMCPSPLTAMLAVSASYFWATAGSVNIYTIPV